MYNNKKESIMKKVFVLVVLFISIMLIGCDIFSEHEVDKHIKYDEEYHWLETSLGDKTEIEPHIFTEEVVKEATCSQKGEKKRSCDCGYIEKVEIETKEHKYDETITNPTCDKEGFITYTCEVCGDTYVENYEDKLGHSFGEWMVVTKPTEDAAGLMIRICSIDESHIDTLNLPKLNSEDYILEAKEPTCEEDGLKKYIYQIDDVIIGDFIIVITKLEHDLETHEAKDVTCEEDGWKEYQTCLNCDYTTYSEIKALGHSYGEWKSNNNGTHTHVCNNDNSHKETKDCTYGEWITVTAAGPFNEGLEKHVCSGCGYTETRVNAATHKHAYSNEFTVDKKATCTEDGLKSKHCTKDNCTSVIEETVIKALGHSYSNEFTVDKKATCTEDGLKSKHCIKDNCTSVIEETVIKALGHSYSNEFTIDKESTLTEVGSKSKHCLNEGCLSRTDITEIPIKHYSDGLLYELNTTKTGYIVSGIGECTDKDIIITPMYNGKPVVSIGSYAFYNCSRLTSITIPESVTSIGSSAFRDCSRLTSITISDSVTSIGEYAFYNCSSLTNVTFEEGSQFTSIVYSVFHGCSNLTSIIIPESVTSIGFSAFYGCSSLTNITFEEGSQLSSIGRDAFYECSSLTSITIPESVTSIGSHAFYGCSSLTSITIPESVTTIGSSAFENCTSLTTITIPFVGNALNGTENTHFGYIFGAYSHNYNSSCVPTSLKEVIITGGESIGDYAFRYCSSLTSITIPESVKSIGRYAFRYCSSLTNVTFEEGSQLTSIGESAFSDCSSLTSITIPESVTSIGSDAFSDCSSLTNVYYNGAIEGWCNISFSSVYSNPMYYAKHFYVLDENKEWYEVISITLPDSVTSIGNYAFYDCSSLTSITIPKSVTSIGKCAFYRCRSLTNVTFEEGSQLTNIGNYAFYSCWYLTSATIPESVTSIGDFAFYNCISLTSIEISESVTYIGSGAFRECTSLTIYCEIESKPDGWAVSWNSSNCPVVWSYKE